MSKLFQKSSFNMDMLEGEKRGDIAVNQMFGNPLSTCVHSRDGVRLWSVRNGP